MDVATALSVAQTLFATLQCAEVRKLCSVFNYESELEKLLKTVETINSFLLDADSKCQELTHEGKCWVQNLKDAVYDADDLFDEYRTIAQQLNGMPGGKLSKKVRRFFSSKNPLLFAYKTSVEVKKLREELDSLSTNHRNFGFSELYKPVKSRVETCSYVYEQDIIGREADKKAIVDLLVKDDSEKNISFVTIVGIGGLGKTALAKLVFSDLRIKEAFEENMYWVCVSENFDMKQILDKMVRKKDLDLEDLQRYVRNEIEGKRYFLVLDDVWCEEGIKWDDLRGFLNLGGKGSRILVTSRSQKVATAIGNYPMHKLQGLSEKDSWELFRKISLGDREDEAVAGFDEIGIDIVKKCANVPLSIRVVASLLRGQNISAWLSYRRIDLAKMRDDEDDLMPTLMFSYYHLDPALKSCFSFCSVFPQDRRIDKEELISLWSAHGYLLPSSPTDNSMEDVGERYFSILLHRCFFHDVKQHVRKNLSVVESVKMHDLMHDLARKVAGKESSTHEVEGKARHLFTDSKECLAKWSSSSNYTSKTLRSLFLTVKGINGEGDCCSIISKCSCLRVLSIHYSFSFRLPDTLGMLLHLRYLDLSNNYNLEMLPKSITKLHNLQTLKLANCEKLKELPEDTSKLVNLRVLDIKGCDRLTHMPVGMGKLTCLHTLTMFIVCRDDDDPKQDKKGKLIDLKPLINNLRGDVCFRHLNSRDECMIVDLDSLKIRYKLDYYQKGQKKLLEILFSNSQSVELMIQSYNGTKLPSWASGLVSIHLISCHKLQYLPSSVSQLYHLKYLSLDDMESMEYIENDAPSPSVKFFPCLEKLKLFAMPKLTEWWRDIALCMENKTASIPSFPRLCKLHIRDCKRLVYIPPCPHVKKLYLEKVNKALTFCKEGGEVESNPIYLNELRIKNSSYVFISLIRKFVGSAVSIKLSDIENLGTIREAFQSCASFLQDLELINCRGIENLGIEHLTNLNSLELAHNIEGIPWRYLHSLSSLSLGSCDSLEEVGECATSLKSLRSLSICFCKKLKSLPEEMCHLTSLTSLCIFCCPKLKSLPEAIKHLTSLNTLTIIDPSPELKERCHKSDGEDWLKICHIPNINVYNIYD